MAWKRWKRASSTAAGSAEALSSSWHVTLPIGLQLPNWWLAGFHKIWLEIRNLLFGHLEPEEVTWPLVLAFWQGLSKTLRHASGTRRQVAARTNRCVCSSMWLYRLLKQFADLPRLDFWRLVKQIKSQMSLFRIFPPPTLPYVLSMGCAVQSGRTTVFSVEDNVKAVHTFRDGGCCERSDIHQPGVSPTNSVSPQSDGKMRK